MRSSDYAKIGKIRCFGRGGDAVVVDWQKTVQKYWCKLHKQITWCKLQKQMTRSSAFGATARNNVQLQVRRTDMRSMVSWLWPLQGLIRLTTNLHKQCVRHRLSHFSAIMVSYLEERVKSPKSSDTSNRYPICRYSGGVKLHGSYHASKSGLPCMRFWTTRETHTFLTSVQDREVLIDCITI